MLDADAVIVTSWLHCEKQKEFYKKIGLIKLVFEF